MKKLTLHKDTLAELTSDELAALQGAALPMTPSCPLTMKIAELVDQVSDRIC